MHQLHHTNWQLTKNLSIKPTWFIMSMSFIKGIITGSHKGIKHVSSVTFFRGIFVGTLQHQKDPSYTHLVHKNSLFIWHFIRWNILRCFRIHVTFIFRGTRYTTSSIVYFVPLLVIQYSSSCGSVAIFARRILPNIFKKFYKTFPLDY